MSVHIYQGDCLWLMHLIPSGSVDLVLCDLPYGTTQNKWDSVIPFEQLWEHYKRICKGAIVLTAGQPFTSALVMSQPKAFKHEWIWIKNRGSNFANTVREPFKEHEEVLVFAFDKWTYNKQMQERTGGGVSRVKTAIKCHSESSNYGKHTPETKMFGDLRLPSSWQKFNTQVGLHPTQKPVALMEYLIRTYTNPGDTVLDNCMGSGTTGVACVNTERNFVGVEREWNYFNIARGRIETAQALRDWERLQA